MHSAVVGLVREGEEGKRKGKGVLCLRVAGVVWPCTDVLRSGRLQFLVLFTSLWHWRCLIGSSGAVAWSSGSLGHENVPKRFHSMHTL